MKAVDRRFLAGLVLAAAWIWLRDPAALAEPADTLPLLAALPLLAWLGAPWRFGAAPLQLHRAWLALAAVALLLGVASGLVGLLALAWTAMLWAWLRSRLEPEARERVWRLLPLAVLAFPWLSLDLPVLGWWFRLSAAWSAGQVYQSLGFTVQREGVQLLVQHLGFDVAPACSGIKGLQAMLVAGTALCFLQLGGRRPYWPSLAVLPLAAWLANTARVLLVIAAALTAGPEFAGGWFHSAGGWLALVAMFGFTWLALEGFRRRSLRTSLA